MVIFSKVSRLLIKFLQAFAFTIDQINTRGISCHVIHRESEWLPAAVDGPLLTLLFLVVVCRLFLFSRDWEMHMEALLILCDLARAV